MRREASFLVILDESGTCLDYIGWEKGRLGGNLRPETNQGLTGGPLIDGDTRYRMTNSGTRPHP
jgi:hypothetical protein